MSVFSCGVQGGGGKIPKALEFMQSGQLQAAAQTSSQTLTLNGVNFNSSDKSTNTHIVVMLGEFTSQACFPSTVRIDGVVATRVTGTNCWYIEHTGSSSGAVQITATQSAASGYKWNFGVYTLTGILDIDNPQYVINDTNGGTITVDPSETIVLITEGPSDTHVRTGGGWSHVSQNYDLANVLATIRDIGLSGHFVSGDSGVLTFTPASGETQTHVAFT